ncbi:MAG: hypothetical protein F4Y44_02410 [Chloroflexi bacterium]|nr:hypothetical protein [Chloroflexota bacterium]
MISRATTEERLARMEQVRENERDWRLDIVNRLDRMEAKVDRILFAMLAIGATLFAAIIASLVTAILALPQN